MSGKYLQGVQATINNNDFKKSPRANFGQKKGKK